ncbi:hypothetical protein NED98_22950 [Sphingomonas sp. MMSM20]|nr:hypothetical protein [Sphingomonas lycopersici]
MQLPDEIALLNFRDHGAQRYRRAVTRDLAALIVTLEHLPKDHAGIRISGIDSLRPFLGPQ